MVQPPLDHHYVVMHLGGAKRVTRRNDGPALAAVAENGSITLVPAGTAYVWRTEGPIAFAHVYLRPSQLEHVVTREFDGHGASVSLIERVGCRDQILEPLVARMLSELQPGRQGSTLLLDSLLESLVIRLASKHSTRGQSARRQGPALAPHRLRRVLDYVDARLASDIALADLVLAAGSSQSHFSHAFRAATGMSPYRYLLSRRVESARVLLLTSNASLQTIAQKCGFNSRREFSLMFKRIAGMAPRQFRASVLGRDSRLPGPEPIEQTASQGLSSYESAS
jgi:AraC family transcriptional regulator